MFGGFLSLVCKIIILNLIIHKVWIMLSNGNDSNSRNSQLNLSEYSNDLNSSMNYNESKLILYNVIKKQSWDDGPVYLNETNRQYIDIFYTQTYVDWNKPFKDRYQIQRIEAKQCTQEDFGNHIRVK